MAYRLTNLIAEREKRNWTQQDLADQLAITKQTIGRWERCLFLPPRSMQQRVAELFDLPVDWLFTSYDEDSPVRIPHSEIPFSSDLTTSTGTTQTPTSCIIDPGIPLATHANFIGRQKELAALKSRLLAGNSVALTALNGLPGVGKTSLTINLANDPDIRHHFRDGILWAGLGPKPNILGILHHWGALLGLSEAEIASLHDATAWGKALHRAIGARYMLLVIDDVWLPEAGLSFQVGGPNCAYLLTTRFPHIANYLATDAAYQLEELSEQESLTLLHFLAPAASRERKKMQDLIRAVGGLPLALTLIGNYLRRQSYSGQARRIVSAFDYLADPSARLSLQEPLGPVGTHTSLTSNTLSLEAIIAASDQQLPEEARRVLYALSIFPSKPNSFSEEAALAVAACDVESLDILVDAGLLSIFGERLTLHQTIHDFARKQLLQTGQEEQVAQRLVRYVTQFVSEHRDTADLEQESGAVFAALDLAEKLNMFDEVVAILLATAPYLLRIALYNKAESYLRVAIQNARTDFVSLLFFLGRAVLAQGAFQEARDIFQRGLELARETNATLSIIDYLSQLGWILPKLGLYEEAEHYLLEGLALARQQRAKKRIGYLLKPLGSLYDLRGRYVEAGKCFQEAYKIACELNDLELVCSTKVNMGVNEGNLGHTQVAEQHFREGLLLARKLGIVETQCVLLVNLGEMGNQRGTPSDLEEAIGYLQECLSLAKHTGIREWEAVAHLVLGAVLTKQGKYQEAETSLDESLAITQQLGLVGKHRIVTQAYVEKADIALAQGYTQKAERLISLGWGSVPEHDQEATALLYYGQARCALACGNIVQARDYGRKSLAIFQSIQHGWAPKITTWLEQLA